MSARLGTAVIRRAIEDAAGLIAVEAVKCRVDGKRVTEADLQAEAYAWLTTPSERLRFWCSLAGVSMEVVIDGADGAIERIRERAGRDGRRRPQRDPSAVREDGRADA